MCLTADRSQTSAVSNAMYPLRMHPPTEPTPTVSRVTSDGTLVELVYDASAATTALAIRERDGEPYVAPELRLPSGEILSPYRAENNLVASGCVLLASELGPSSDTPSLIHDIEQYLDAYVELNREFRTIAAHYALLTWVYDAFRELPYLRFRGDYGTGKTRALLALGSICYKPFFASGASTVSPIFHLLDTFRGTLVLDEADFRFSDTTSPLTKILNNGNVDGLPVLRTLTNRNREFDPKAFRVFGPKLVGMREGFDDAALESRFLTEEMTPRPLRSGIPIHTPKSLSEDALALRNQLLTYRMMNRQHVAADPSKLAEGVEPRTNQVALALGSLIDDAAVLSGFHAHLRALDKRRQLDRAALPEADVLIALLELWAAGGARNIPVSQVAKVAEMQTGRSHSPKGVGWILRAKLNIAPHKSNGVYVIPYEQRAHASALATRFGVAEAPIADPPTLFTPTDHSRADIQTTRDDDSRP